MSTVPRKKKRRSLAVVLDGITWKQYGAMVRSFAEGPRVKLTYDRGRLEIMSPLARHEWHADFLGGLVCLIADELGMEIVTGGSSTLRRKTAKRGLEPDRCYWIANERFIRGKDRLDLRVDPPPDLAIEVDVTSSSLDRMAIYAALGVPEVWRFDAVGLSFHALTAGQYQPILQSRSFPIITASDLLPVLSLRATQGDTTARRDFRSWLRSRLTPPTP